LRSCEKLAEFDTFAPASAHAKQLRATKRPNRALRIRVMFAETAGRRRPAAADPRAGPSGDE
jgi:hypothetical protein